MSQQLRPAPPIELINADLDDTTISDTLEVWGEAQKKEIERLIAEQRLIEQQLAKLRERVSGVNALLMSLGQSPIEIDDTRGEGHGFATPGNRGDDMPDRREAFSSKSLVEAATIILADGAALHADEIAQRIFDIQDKHDLNRVKRSLVSTLSSGVKRGLWERTAPNTYQVKK